MSVLMFLAPTSIILGLIGLGAFWWTVKSGQYDDLKGDAMRILDDHERDGPE